MDSLVKATDMKNTTNNGWLSGGAVDWIFTRQTAGKKSSLSLKISTAKISQTWGETY